MNVHVLIRMAVCLYCERPSVLGPPPSYNANLAYDVQSVF